MRREIYYNRYLFDISDLREHTQELLTYLSALMQMILDNCVSNVNVMFERVPYSVIIHHTLEFGKGCGKDLFEWLDYIILIRYKNCILNTEKTY